MKKKVLFGVKVPEGVVVKVKLRQKVERGAVLAIEKGGKEKSVDMSFWLTKLPKEIWEKIAANYKNKKIKLDEVMAETGGLFSKKLTSPVEGTFLRFDEFGNMWFRENDETEKEIIAPVGGIIKKIEKDKVLVEITVEEVKGEGLNQTKNWGIKGREVETIFDLKREDAGTIIFTKRVSRAMLLKAEAMGVAGVMVDEVENGVEGVSIPVIKVKTWPKKGEGRMWLNGGKNIVWLVVE